ncbi:MAG: hypothetical protein AB1345_08590 [Chloroflexota bacterium]
MAKYKPYRYDQLVMIPISLQNQLEPGTLEYTINALVENHLDLSVFEERHRHRCVHPVWADRAGHRDCRFHRPTERGRKFEVSLKGFLK